MPEYTTGKFDRENMRLQKIILDLRAVLGPAIEAARESQMLRDMREMMDHSILKDEDFMADDNFRAIKDKALLAAGEILGLTEKSAEESEAG